MHPVPLVTRRAYVSLGSNVGDRARHLTEGLVITIEPIISAGRGSAELKPDKWTVCTSDGSLAAHHEHTIVITTGAPILLTAA